MNMQSNDYSYTSAVREPCRKWGSYMIRMKKVGEADFTEYSPGNDEFVCKSAEITESICSYKPLIGVAGSREMVLELYYPGGVPSGLVGAKVSYSRALLNSDNALHSHSGIMNVKKMDLVNNNFARLYCYDGMELLKGISFTATNFNLRVENNTTLFWLLNELSICVSDADIGIHLGALSGDIEEIVDTSSINIAMGGEGWSSYTVHEVLEAIAGVLGGFIIIDRQTGYPRFKRYLEANYEIPTDSIRIGGLVKLEDEPVTVKFSAVPYTQKESYGLVYGEFPTEYPVPKYDYSAAQYLGEIPPGMIPPWLYDFGERPYWILARTLTYASGGGYEFGDEYVYVFFKEDDIYRITDQYISINPYPRTISSPALDVQNDGLINSASYKTSQVVIRYSPETFSPLFSGSYYFIQATNYEPAWPVNPPDLKPYPYETYDAYLADLASYRGQANMSMKFAEDPDFYLAERYVDVKAAGSIPSDFPRYYSLGYEWIVASDVTPATNFPGSISRLYLYVFRGVLDNDSSADYPQYRYPQVESSTKDGSVLILDMSGAVNGGVSDDWPVYTYYIDIDWNNPTTALEWQFLEQTKKLTLEIPKRNILACSTDIYTPEGVLLVPRYVLDFWKQGYIPGKVLRKTFGNDYSNFLITDKNVDYINANCMPPALSYTPVELDWRGDPRLEVGDIITVKDRHGRSLTVPIMEQTMRFEGGLSAFLKAVYDDEKADEYCD